MKRAIEMLENQKQSLLKEREIWAGRKDSDKQVISIREKIETDLTDVQKAINFLSRKDSKIKWWQIVLFFAILAIAMFFEDFIDKITL